ncbi:hypothetical protein WB401_36310 [Streptomyces brasiliscabiei]|uniref:Secreted protein n=2 Tax=Streptomyces TaxID=1883 RepID=A0ABU8GNS4_9ACTN|nr:hypothetical protein [Streptomyces griseiscabiei]MBZ3906488.1 hypothetical protein [Streptomyces griseiscabiei]MDX2911485.1 hypothetical protein [Streptomyces griseiscabiei]
MSTSVRTALQSKRRALLTSAGVAGAALTLAVTSATSAYAQSTYIYQGSDFALLDSNGLITICDKEADGNQAYVEVRWGPSLFHKRTYDANGSAAGCSTKAYDDGGFYAARVCENVNNADDPCTGRFLYW